MAKLLGLAAIVIASLVAASTAADHAASFTFQDIDGNVWVGEDLLGGVVVLFFTATWCEPCWIAEDGLEDLFQSYGADATFLGVFLAPSNNASSLESYRQSSGTPWPIGPEQDDMQTRFGIASIPVIFVLRYTGDPGFQWQPSPGGLTAAEVRAVVGNALERSIAEVPIILPPPAQVAWWPPLAVSAVVSSILLLSLRRIARTDGR